MKKLLVSLIVPAALFAQTTLTKPNGGITFCAGHATLNGTKAFDQGGTVGFNHNDSRWLANESAMPNAFVTYSFPHDTVVNGYGVFGLHSDNFGLARGPKSWSLEGSPDMQAWTLVDTQSNMVWTSLQVRRFPTASTNSFRHWRFTMHENNGNADYVGIQELELYGYYDYTEPPKITALPWEHAGVGSVRLGVQINEGGCVDAFVAWGDSPGDLANTNDILRVSNKFELTLSNLGDFQTYWYTVFVTNECGRAELPAPVLFTTRGPVFYWNKPAGGQWADAGNWNNADGTPAGAFPNAAGDVAVLTNTSATVFIGQDVTLGELHIGVAGVWAAPTFTNSMPGAKLVFDNGPIPALLAFRNAYASPRFRIDWEIRNGLTIDNASESAVVFHAKVAGAKPDITVVRNQLRWSPVADTVYTGNLATTGTGIVGKDGPLNLTFLNGTHAMRFGSMYTEGDAGGLHGVGALTVSGGVFTNFNGSYPYLFADSNGYVVFTNGARYVPSTGGSMGRTDRVATNSTIIVAGDGTVWDGKQSMSIRTRNNFFLRNGARAEMGTVSLEAAGCVEITGTDPSTGAPALMNLNNNSFWIGIASPTVHSNRVFVADGGVLSNATVRIYGEYSGTTNSFIKVSGGGRVYGNLAMGQGGNQVGNCIDNFAWITGENSIWTYPTAGTVQIGPRANGLADIGNYIKVEKSGVFTNAGFNIGYNTNTGNLRSNGNHLDIVDGGKVFSTQDSAIGVNLYTSVSNTSRVENCYALVGGGAAKSLWSLGGKNLRVGRSDGLCAWSFGNHLEAQTNGSVTNIATLYVGTSDVNANSNNFVRLSGGTVSATAMEIKKNNGLEAVVGPNGPGKITLSGTALISSGTFVRAKKTKSALTGDHVILKANLITDGGIKLSPDTDTAIFKLTVTSTEIILRYHEPRTLFMLR